MLLRKRAWLLLLALIIASAAVLIIVRADRKKAVESLLGKAHDAIEAGDIDKLAPLISLNYRDDLGLNCAALRGSFEYIFSKYSDIAVDYSIIGITVGKDTVTASLTVWGSGAWNGIRQDIAGSENDPVPLTVFCRKEFLSWKIAGSAWPSGRAGLQKFF